MGCSQIPRTCLGSRKGQEREEKGQWSLQASWPVQQEGTSSGGGGGGGGSAVLDKQQNSCPHWEKDEGLGGAPSEGPEPELGSASVIWIRKTLG